MRSEPVARYYDYLLCFKDYDLKKLINMPAFLSKCYLQGPS